VMPIGKLAPELAVLVRVGVVQLSETDGVVQVAGAVVALADETLMLILTGQLVIVGAMISFAQALNG
jgi:hypothetical protein